MLGLLPPHRHFLFSSMIKWLVGEKEEIIAETNDHIEDLPENLLLGRLGVTLVGVKGDYVEK